MTAPILKPLDPIYARNAPLCEKSPGRKKAKYERDLKYNAERVKRSLERIAMALENLSLGRGVHPCWYCNPGLSNTTEQKNVHYCPICGRKLIKEN